MSGQDRTGSSGVILIALLVTIVPAGSGGTAIDPEIADHVDDALPTHARCNSPGAFDLLRAWFSMPNETVLEAHIEMKTSEDSPWYSGGTLTPCDWAIIWSDGDRMLAARYRVDDSSVGSVTRTAWLAVYDGGDRPGAQPAFGNLQEITATNTDGTPGAIHFEIPADLVFRNGTHNLIRPWAASFTAKTRGDGYDEVMWATDAQKTATLIDRAPDCNVGDGSCTTWGTDFVSPYHSPPRAADDPRTRFNEISPDGANATAANGTDPSQRAGSSADGAANGLDGTDGSKGEPVAQSNMVHATPVPWWADEVAQAVVGFIGLAASAAAAFLAFVRIRRRRTLMSILLRRVEGTYTHHKNRPETGAEAMSELRREIRAHHERNRIEDAQFIELDRRVVAYQSNLRIRAVEESMTLPQNVLAAVRKALSDDVLHASDLHRIAAALDRSDLAAVHCQGLLETLGRWVDHDGHRGPSPEVVT